MSDQFTNEFAAGETHGFEKKDSYKVIKTSKGVAPGATCTWMLKVAKRASAAPKLRPMSRLVQPREVPALAACPLSEGTAGVTGQQIVTCGGALL